MACQRQAVLGSEVIINIVNMAIQVEQGHTTGKLEVTLKTHLSGNGRQDFTGLGAVSVRPKI